MVTAAVGSGQSQKTNLARPAGRLKTLVILAYALFWLLPVGLVFAVIACVLAVKRHNYRGPSIGALILNIATAVIVGPLLILALLFSASSIHPNVAQQDAKPVQSALKQQGATMVCDYGDSGYGIDNTQPWYAAYYKVNDSSGLITAVTQAAASKGYTLQADPNAEKRINDQASHVFPRPPGYNPHASYLVASQGDKSMEVDIIRNGALTFDCMANSVTYGEQRQVSGSDDFVKIYVSYPDRVK